jgi:type II secretory pathway component HofQ
MIAMMAAGGTGWLALAALALGSFPGGGKGEARISLDVKEAPVVGIVRVLAEAGGFQVVFDAGISCQLTMKLPSARWRQALDTALSACDLGYEEEGDVLRVAPVSRLRQEAEARRKLAEERRLTAAGRLASFRLSYARAQELAPLLERILAPGGHVSYDPRTGTLIVAY